MCFIIKWIHYIHNKVHYYWLCMMQLHLICQTDWISDCFSWQLYSIKSCTTVAWLRLFSFPNTPTLISSFFKHTDLIIKIKINNNSSIAASNSSPAWSTIYLLWPPPPCKHTSSVRYRKKGCIRMQYHEKWSNPLFSLYHTMHVKCCIHYCEKNKMNWDASK